MGSNGFEPLKAKSQQIYSLSPLAARATPRIEQNLQGPAEAAPVISTQVRRDERSNQNNPANELVEGFEPPTRCLQNSCSTDWATPALILITKIQRQ